MSRRSITRPVPGAIIAPIVFAVAMALAFSAAGPAQAEPVLAAQGDGAALYDQYCGACHQPGGVGVSGSFPPLAGNPSAADAAAVDDVIRNGKSGPIEVDGVSYDTVMPPVAMSDDERAAVVEYVVGLASSAVEETATPEVIDSADAAPVTGDVDRGRRLFIGADRFENGGGACGSCHQAADVGHRGGPGLGPDLDASFDNLGGDAGLSAWLASPPSATMQPIFADDPLTENEIADLVAFLAPDPDRSDRGSSGDTLLLGGVIGLAVLLGAMALIGRSMSSSYTQRLRGTR